MPAAGAKIFKKPLFAKIMVYRTFAWALFFKQCWGCVHFGLTGGPWGRKKWAGRPKNNAGEKCRTILGPTAARPPQILCHFFVKKKQKVQLGFFLITFPFGKMAGAGIGSAETGTAQTGFRTLIDGKTTFWYIGFLINLYIGLGLFCTQGFL